MNLHEHADGSAKTAGLHDQHKCMGQDDMVMLSMQLLVSNLDPSSFSAGAVKFSCLQPLRSVRIKVLMVRTHAQHCTVIFGRQETGKHEPAYPMAHVDSEKLGPHGVWSGQQPVRATSRWCNSVALLKHRQHLQSRVARHSKHKRARHWLRSVSAEDEAPTSLSYLHCFGISIRGVNMMLMVETSAKTAPPDRLR